MQLWLVRLGNCVHTVGRFAWGDLGLLTVCGVNVTPLLQTRQRVAQDEPPVSNRVTGSTFGSLGLLATNRG